MTAASIRYDGFFSWQVFVDLLRDNAFLGIAAIGMTFVIISGGIDLSVGANIGFTSILIGTLMTRQGWPAPLAITLALATGIVFGAAMGAVIAFVELPPFLVTLAGMFLARGLGFVISLETISIGGSFYRRSMISAIACSRSRRWFSSSCWRSEFSSRTRRDLVGPSMRSAATSSRPSSWVCRCAGRK